MKQFCRLVKTHTFLTCLVLAAVLLASIIIGIGTGPVAIPFAEVWRVMFHRHSPRIRWPSPMCWAFPPAHH